MANHCAGIRCGAAPGRSHQCSRVRIRLARIRGTFAVTKLVVRNSLVLVATAAVAGVYFSKYASTVPQEWILVVNFVLVPVVLGALTYFLFAGERFTRLALVGAIPVLSILLAGGDPAKPGLALGLIGPLLIVFLLGAGISVALQWFLKARNSNQG